MTDDKQPSGGIRRAGYGGLSGRELHISCELIQMFRRSRKVPHGNNDPSALALRTLGQMVNNLAGGSAVRDMEAYREGSCVFSVK